MTGKPVEIALVDDHRMFLDGLREVIASLDPAYRCAGFASPHNLLIEIESGRRYDLIVSDLVMALQARKCTIPVLIVSGIDTLPPVEKVLRIGAMGFVPKSAPAKVLGAAIKQALRGEVFLPPELWAVIENDPHSPRLTEGRSPEHAEESRPVGARQLEVLRLVAEGYSNRSISDVLGISENTVKTHIKQIFKQLNVTRRTACVSKARAMGLID